MKNRVPYIALLFAWVFLLHPVTHISIDQDHCHVETVPQACEFCQSQVQSSSAPALAQPSTAPFVYQDYSVSSVGPG
ncbi:MAG: hypothetical protein WC314_11660, partial [Vulcanimicrobiota bacterium]